jgi:transcriptional regulator with XRE-family HTH domain
MDRAERDSQIREVPIDGRYPELAREVRRVLGWEAKDGQKFYTSRSAQRKIGVNHVTIANMARGDRPSVETLVKFAEAFNVDLPHLLNLSGYIAKLPAPIISPQEQKLLNGLRRLTPDQQAELHAQIEAEIEKALQYAVENGLISEDDDEEKMHAGEVCQGS